MKLYVKPGRPTGWKAMSMALAKQGRIYHHEGRDYKGPGEEVEVPDKFAPALVLPAG
jgi:hypothetical protein